MAKAKKAEAKKPKKAEVKKAVATPPTVNTAETFTVHNVGRVLTEAGNRTFKKIPCGTFTADLSSLNEAKAAEVRKALRGL